MNPITLPFKLDQLHIPDGFLSLPVALVFWALTILFVWLAIRNTRGELGERQIPLMGVMAAFIFAAQMINFPVAGGTSGHLLGGALAAIILGPWAAILVMTAVIAVQALVFQDGGLIVMGANIFNMGILTALIGYGLYRGAANRGRGTKLATAGVAAWLSVLAGALLRTWGAGHLVKTDRLTVTGQLPRGSEGYLGAHSGDITLNLLGKVMLFVLVAFWLGYCR